MTTEEKIQILRNAADRAYETIAETPGAKMASQDFLNLLYAADRLHWMEHVLTEGPPPFEPESREPEPEKTTEPVEIESEKPAAEQPAKPNDAEPAVKIESSTVRGALSAARAKGVDVAAIITSFGAKSFSDLSPSDYPAIMEALEKVKR